MVGWATEIRDQLLVRPGGDFSGELERRTIVADELSGNWEIDETEDGGIDVSEIDTTHTGHLGDASEGAWEAWMRECYGEGWPGEVDERWHNDHK